MRVAVLSDIHSNYYAFNACYEDAVKCGAKSFIFLGDYVSDLSEPQRTMDLLYEIQSKYPTVCLRGNREGYMLDCENGSSRFARGSKSGSLLFTYDHLRKKDLDFIRGLKISDTVVIDGVRIEIAHAAMDNDRYYFDSNDGHTAEIFQQMKCDYLLTGHSHKQYIQKNAGKTIINPGSVGIPQDGTRNPKYALLDVANRNVSCQLREVPYDMTAAIHSQFASGLVDYAKYWAIGILYDIITGDEWVLKILRCVEKNSDFHNEEAWRSATVELGMKLTEQEILEWYRMNNVEIRKLAESDYDQVIELYTQLDEFHVQARPDCFVHRERDKIYPKDAFIHNLSYPGGLELGAFDGDLLVGILRATLWEESFMRKDLKTVCLDDIYVLPTYRRRGIAAKLFSEVESWAKEQGAIRLELHTWDFNKGAIAMYEAMGMTPQRYVFEKKL